MALEITWHRQGINPNIAGPPILSETLALSGSAALSAAAPDGAESVRIQSTEAARYAIGAAPTATATAGAQGHYLAAAGEAWLPARPGATKVSGIQAA